MKPQPKVLTFLTILSVLLFLGALGMVLVFAPIEAVMGYVQKIFYFHISNAWVGMLGFMVAAVSGITYLVTKDLKCDCKWFHLGETHLGHLLDVGCPPHHRCHPGDDLPGLSFASPGD